MYKLSLNWWMGNSSVLLADVALDGFKMNNWITRRRRRCTVSNCYLARCIISHDCCLNVENQLFQTCQKFNADAARQPSQVLIN